MSKPHIIQVLCPRRHCIVGLAYQDRDPKEMLTLVRHRLDDLIKRGAINSWCGICQATKDQWFYEDRELSFDTLADAMQMLKEEEEEQAKTADFYVRLYAKHSRG